MADVDLNIRATDQGSQNIKRFGENLAKIGLAALGVTSGLSAARMGLDMLAGTAKAAWQALEQGAALELAKSRFENLSTSIGTTADALRNDLRAATGGMMSDAALIASASDIMSLGLAKTHEQTVRLASVVGQLGWDMQQVVLTMANNSKMRLDALGLSVEDVDARVAKLRETGMSLDEAFDLAVIEAGEAKLGLLGSAAETTAGKLKQMMAAVEDAKNAFAQTFAEELADNIDQMGDGTQALGENLQYAAEGAAKLAAALASPFIDAAVGTGQLAQIQDLRTEIEEMTDSIPELNAAWFTWLNATAPGASIEDRAKAIEELQTQLANLQDQQLRDNPELRYAGWQMEAEAIQEGTAVLGEWTDKAKKAAIEAGDLAGAFEGIHRAGITGATQSGIWTVAGQHIRDILDEAADAAEEDAKRIEEANQEAAAAIAAMWRDAGLEMSASFNEYVTGIKDSQIPDLVTPERDFSYQVTVSAPFEDDARRLEEYTSRAERAAQTLDDLTHGIGTFGMDQDKINEKIAKAAEELAYYQSLMGTIAPTITETVSGHAELAFNMDLVRDAMYEAGTAAGASIGQLGELGVAMGEFSPEVAEAAAKAALFKEALSTLAGKWKLGELDTTQYLAAVDDLVTELENNSLVELQVKLATPETDWASLPGFSDVVANAMQIPVEIDALKGALDVVDGIPDNDQKIITFDPEYEEVTAAIGEIESGISAIDGTVTFTPMADAVEAKINEIDGRHLTIYVDYVPTGTPEIEGRASGGPVSGGSPYWVGEAGPELFVPWSSGTIVPTSQASAMAGGGLNVNMTVTFNGPADPPAVQRAIYTGMSEFYADLQRQGVRG